MSDVILDFNGVGNQTDVKGLETWYNGYRFRSRLEARWAVWHDLCDIGYVYELRHPALWGLYYLPDFPEPLDPELTRELERILRPCPT
jgi:hypothetical protein